jgi:hypothetical protein
MALPPAQEYTTLISARQQNDMGSFYLATKSKSLVRASSFELLLLRLYIGQTASP